MKVKLKNKLAELPRSPGVYIYRDNRNRVIYVGKAVNLKNRVSSYFQKTEHDPKTTELVKNIDTLEWLTVESEFEALIVEADLIKRYKPKYNIRLRDDKNYTYVKISGDNYPRISIVHQITDHTARYLGPYTDSGAVKSILKLVRHIYPYCTCAKPDNEVCLYHHLGLCPGHGPKYISEKDYLKNIKGIEAIFSGKIKKLSIKYSAEMKRLAKLQQFEEAARYRDRLYYLKKIEKSRVLSDRDLASDVALTQLTETLSLSKVPKRIECFDISNILGTAAVGSMVVFEGGIAIPAKYRRFKIKTVQGANDFASMAEVLRRRFKESTKSKPDASFGTLPDLIILDGGKGQLSAVVKNVDIPDGVRVISLAKKQEEIFVITDKGFSRHLLPEGSEGYFLVQRIRDEAHRFAITYHRNLKGRELFETTLDAVPGVGPKMKKKLISSFGSIKNIQAADIIELEKVVGKKLAQKIKELL